MNLRRAKLGLWVITVTSVAGTLGVMAAQWHWSVRPPKPVAVVVDEPAVAAARGVPNFAEVRGLDLRRPLIEQTPLAEQPTQPSLGLGFKLLGTIIEPGRSYAVFQIDADTVAVRGVGEQAGIAEVLDIRPRGVTIRYNGTTRELSLPQRPTGANP